MIIIRWLDLTKWRLTMETLFNIDFLILVLIPAERHQFILDPCYWHCVVCEVISVLLF